MLPASSCPNTVPIRSLVMRRMTVVVLLAAFVVVAPASASNWLQLGSWTRPRRSGTRRASPDPPDAATPDRAREPLPGRRLGVARELPDNGTNPEDKAYEWDRYDAAVMAATQRAVSVSSSRSSAPRGGRTAGAPEQGAAEHEAAPRVRLRGRRSATAAGTGVLTESSCRGSRSGRPGTSPTCRSG